MPRIGRNLVDNQIYHIINRGNRRETVFHDRNDYERFLKLLFESKERYNIKIKGTGTIKYNKYSFSTYPKVNYIYKKREGSIQSSKMALYNRLTHIQTVSRLCQLENISHKESIHLLNLAMLNFKYGSKSLSYLKYKKEK